MPVGKKLSQMLACLPSPRQLMIIILLHSSKWINLRSLMSATNLVTFQMLSIKREWMISIIQNSGRVGCVNNILISTPIFHRFFLKGNICVDIIELFKNLLPTIYIHWVDRYFWWQVKFLCAFFSILWLTLGYNWGPKHLIIKESYKQISLN